LKLYFLFPADIGIATSYSESFEAQFLNFQAVLLKALFETNQMN